MLKGDTMSLGKFRELTKDLPDETALLIVAPGGREALAITTYDFETSLDSQGVFLLDQLVGESVHFTD